MRISSSPMTSKFRFGFSEADPIKNDMPQGQWFFPASFEMKIFSKNLPRR